MGANFSSVPEEGLQGCWSPSRSALIEEHRLGQHKDLKALIVDACKLGMTPLHVACTSPMRDPAEVVRLLLASMSDEQIAMKDGYRMTGFGYAIRMGRLSVLECFVKSKAIDVGSLLQDRLNQAAIPLHRLLQYGEPFLKRLLKAVPVEELHSTTVGGMSLVHAVCTRSSDTCPYDVAKYLFSRIPREALSACDHRQRSPLQLAVGHSLPRVTRRLLHVLGDSALISRGCGGGTPIHFLGAYTCNYEDLASTVELVLSRASKAALMQLDDDNASFIHRVCSRAAYRDDNRGKTVLEMSVKMYPDLVRELLFVGPRNPLFRLAQKPFVSSRSFMALLGLLDDVEEKDIVEIFTSPGTATESAITTLFKNYHAPLALVTHVVSWLPSQVLQRPLSTPKTALRVLMQARVSWKRQPDSLPVITRILDTLTVSELTSPSDGGLPYLTCAARDGLFLWATEILARLPEPNGCAAIRTMNRTGREPALRFLIAVLEGADQDELRHDGEGPTWFEAALMCTYLSAHLSEWIHLVPDFVIEETEKLFDIPCCLLRNLQEGGDNLLCILDRLSDRAFCCAPNHIHFLSFLCTARMHRYLKPGAKLPTDEVVDAILERVPAEAYLTTTPSGETFLHHVANNSGDLDLFRLGLVLAGAPRELFSVRESRGRTALDFAMSSRYFPEEGRSMLTASVKGAGCS